MKTNIEIIDGFVWSIIDAETAQKPFETEEVFILHDDHSETLIESYEDFKIAKFDNKKLALEIGIEAELKADWQEASEKNNEKRSFTAWLEAKAEALTEA